RLSSSFRLHSTNTNNTNERTKRMRNTKERNKANEKQNERNKTNETKRTKQNERNKTNEKQTASAHLCCSFSPLISFTHSFIHRHDTHLSCQIALASCSCL